MRGYGRKGARGHRSTIGALALFLWLGSACLLAGCRDGAAGLGGRQGDDRAAAAVLPPPPAIRGAVHVVRLTARGDRYAFEPSEIHVRPGDLVRFVHTDHQPESVAFDLEQLPPGGAEFLLERGIARGPLLTRPGAVFDVHFLEAPEGSYPFLSLPHAEFGMRGTVVVSRDDPATAAP